MFSRSKIGGCIDGRSSPFVVENFWSRCHRVTVNANTYNSLGRATSRSSSRRDEPLRSGARERHAQNERPGASRRGCVYVRRHGDCSTGCAHTVKQVTVCAVASTHSSGADVGVASKKVAKDQRIPAMLITIKHQRSAT